MALPLFGLSQNNLKFGFNAGVSVADVRGNGYATDFNYGFGYLAGVSLDIPIAERLSLTTALNYERKAPVKKEDYREMDLVFGPGGIGQEVIYEGTTKVTTLLEYVSIPVNLKYYVGNNKNYYMTAGLFAAFMIDERVKVKDANPMENYHNNFDTLDYGINFGFGKKLRLNETQYLNIELRDNFGLANIKDDDKISTNSISIIANWQFNL